MSAVFRGAGRSVLPATRPVVGAADDLTILLVPGRHHAVRRLRLPRARRRTMVLSGLLALGACNFAAVQYAWAVQQAARLPALLQAHERLSLRLAGLGGEVQRLDSALARIERMAQRVQAITQLNDPVRNLRLGPLNTDPKAPVPQVLYAHGERIEYEDELVDSNVALRLVDNDVHRSQATAQRAEREIESVLTYLGGRSQLVATTPSIRPVRSHLLSSRFGPRTDPFTGQEVMHKGIDFVADLNDEVWAPADGRVIFVGTRGQGYGLTVVVDHGFGVQTHFAHLGRATVAVGEALRRGQTLGLVGNSGRSTGAHLHYEVRFAGLPEDPERFILD